VQNDLPGLIGQLREVGDDPCPGAALRGPHRRDRNPSAYAVAGQNRLDQSQLVNTQTDDGCDVEEPRLVDKLLADRQGVDG
jgi:hypothetical protein